MQSPRPAQWFHATLTSVCLGVGFSLLSSNGYGRLSTIADARRRATKKLKEAFLHFFHFGEWIQRAIAFI